MFLVGHDVKYIGSQANLQRNQRFNPKEVLDLKKKNHDQETNLKQKQEELEQRQKHIHKLENEVKDLNMKNQKDMSAEKEVLKLKKENSQQEIRLKEQTEELEKRIKDIQMLKNEVKDIKSFNSVWTINPSDEVKVSSLFVAAIEIGTMFVNAGYSSREDPSKISAVCKWPLVGVYENTLCVPTVVLFDENKKFHSFGYEAENTYSELSLDEERNKWYFFKRFKTELNEDKIELNDVNGRKMNTVVVFGAVIKYIKDYLMDALKKALPCIQNEDIYWVLPVPAMWTMFARQIIQQAANTAGIVSEQLTIVSKPEVSSLYCEMVPWKMIKGSNEEIHDITRPGTKCMVIDLGATTADITVHERQADGDLKELHKVSSGALRGTKVNEEFFLLLQRMIGGPVYQKFITEYPEDYLDLQREFEIKKRVITPNSSGKIAVRLPCVILETYEDEMGETVNKAVEKSPFSGKITVRAPKMRIDVEILKNLFKPSSDEIVARVQYLLKQADVHGTNIFIMVGGFSESLMIQDAITKALPRGKFIIPAEPGLTVLQGAVMYGHRYLESCGMKK